MIRRLIAMTMATALVLVVAACSIDTELGGTKLPNSRPDTRVTGQPPTLLEAGFAVHFNWTGSDPDGRIVGYQWKISDNGIDGISARDTLTEDPLTGAELHPWNFTAATDSIFLVLADQADFPGDDTGDPNNPGNPRSFRSHTLFIRSVDDKGAVDPSPALISFTSTTIVPTVRVDYPNLSNQGFSQVPPTVNVGWEGIDDDFSLRVPTRVRFLWKEAVTPEGETVLNPYTYGLLWDKILNFDDPEWSNWFSYAPKKDDRKATFRDKVPGHYYLFAVQVQDTAGAVSVGLDYQQEVGHFRIIQDFWKPQLTLAEPFLGSDVVALKEFEIAGGQPLNFSWSATSAAYNGEVVSYRHGWDITDVNDPNDPGWAIPPGLSEQNRFATERIFQTGVHSFIVVAEDDSGQKRQITWTLRVIPFVDPEFQQELMVIDQVVDDLVQNWPDESGAPRNAERFRNAWWHFLADGSGGVAGINWDRDWYDHTTIVTYSDVVKYKVVLCYAQSNRSQTMFGKFRAINRVDQFVWLAPFQQRGGNLFLVGGSSMESFIESEDNYMVPMVFESREPDLVLNGVSYIVSFGTKELPDETRVVRGPLMYPYATAGIAALDWTAPNTKFIYNRPHRVNRDRAPDCVGLKGLVLNDDFRNFHLVGPGVIADTMWTEPEIDWQDARAVEADTLPLFSGKFIFLNDEFVDANISTRSTVIKPQECDSPEAPGGLCIEPMFNGIARFDWVREYHFNRTSIDTSEARWPHNQYTAFELNEGCGPVGLTSYNEIALSSGKTNGKTFGYFSYKMARDKPIPEKADVYWGFDPYRFDHTESRKAIRWVLKYFGLQINQ